MRKIKMVLNKFMAITTGELLTVGLLPIFYIPLILSHRIYSGRFCLRPSYVHSVH